MSDTKTSGIGFVGALAITFIVLKLTHVIDWSWVWVLSPIWVSTVLAILFILILLGVGAIMTELKNKR